MNNIGTIIAMGVLVMMSAYFSASVSIPSAPPEIISVTFWGMYGAKSKSVMLRDPAMRSFIIVHLILFLIFVYTYISIYLIKGIVKRVYIY